MSANPDVETWFAEKQPPQAEAMLRVREIVLSVNPLIEETIKWSTPTFMYKGNIASFNPAKNLVSLLFHRGAEIPDSHRRLEGEGDTARVMRLWNLADVEAGRADLEAVILAWCEMRDSS
ncbi:MAG: DUF1801 domain-containing protein [Acidimicrobiia bacterium]